MPSFGLSKGMATTSSTLPCPVSTLDKGSGRLGKQLGEGSGGGVLTSRSILKEEGGMQEIGAGGGVSSKMAGAVALP